MTTMEFLEMTAKFAASLAAIFAAIALIMNTRAFRLQKRSLEANLFNDFRRRIEDLEDQHANIGTGESDKLEKWYSRMFSVFESFAFYANRGYLEKDMSEFYASGIDYYIRSLSKFPKLLQDYKNREPGEFSELENYYRRVLKKKLPF